MASGHGAARETAKQNGSCSAKGSNKQPLDGPLSFGQQQPQLLQPQVNFPSGRWQMGLINAYLSRSNLLPGDRKIHLLSIRRNDDFLVGFAT